MDVKMTTIVHGTRVRLDSPRSRKLKSSTSMTSSIMEAPRLLYVAVLLAVVLVTAESACTSGVIELWAYSNPSTHHFKDSYTKYISSDKGSECRWKVTASKSNQVVKLTFSSFNLRQSKSNRSNDCLEIFDGESRHAKLVERACLSQPKDHTSSGRHFFIVYHRGKGKGQREFDIVVVAEDVMDKDQIIRIAIIIGGCVAAFVLFYLVCRATKCCACLRKKASQDGEIANGYERDRLTGVAGNTQHETTASAPPQEPSGASPPTGTANGEGDSVSLPSDTPSLHELNEPPPSYESLYLNEDGVAPPEYTPPRHKKSHPPRRVHTFN